MKSRFIRILARLQRLPRLVTLVAGIGLMIVIGTLDVITGHEVGLSLFYLIPIALLGWGLDIRYGIAASFSCAVVWFLADAVLGVRPYSSAWIPYWNAAIRFGFFLIITTLMVQMREKLNMERKFARRDFSTGLANNQAFYEYAHVEIDRSQRYGHPLAITYIDCDNFKFVNDSLGHHMGDKLLKVVGQTIQKSLRKSDFVARLGGDEFAVLFPETDAVESLEVAEKLQEALRSEMVRNGWSVTFSFGLVTFVTPPDTVDELIRVADAHMYAAKKTGKNKINQEVVTRPKSRQSQSEIPGEINQPMR